MDIRQNGHDVPALVQATKQGFLYVLNRLTGEPVYPMRRRRCPHPMYRANRPRPPSPMSVVPEPTTPCDHFPGISTLADLRAAANAARNMPSYRDEGKFTPPSLQGSIAFPAPTTGGMEWGGGAVDPVSQTYVVNSSNVVQVYKLIPRAEFDALDAKKSSRAAARPSMNRPMPRTSITFLNRWGMPCWKPPYGTLSSYDLKTGKLLWRHPFGQVQQWGFYMPESWGSVTIGGAGDHQDRPDLHRRLDGQPGARHRPQDRQGAVESAARGAHRRPRPRSIPIKGKQYVVFAAGGNPILMPKLGDELAAFALPD